MENSIVKVNPNGSIFIKILTLLNILEGFVALAVLVLIPKDPKNAVLWGYSASRLLIIGAAVFILLSQIYILFRSQKVLDLVEKVLNTKHFIQIIKLLGILFGLLLWLTTWFPPERLAYFSAFFVRIKPVLIWLELIVFQFYIFLKFLLQEIDFSYVGLRIKGSKTLKFVLILTVLGIGVFLLMRMLSHPSPVNSLIAPPSASISSLQLFLSGIPLLVILFLEHSKEKKFQGKGWIVVTFLTIWVITTILWNSAPFTCTDDRPGPYPPNNQCYAPINDAVYSIGSHYVTLGEGVYNHWQTDKPLYMVFLAIGQFIAGQRVDQYLTFQIVFLALMPALLFLLGREIMGYGEGLFLAFLSLILGYNEIVSYQLVGGVNAKLENTELLTAFFLILLAISVFGWWKKKSAPVWAVISGGVLGLSSLVRLNPLFILPLLGIATMFLKRKKGKVLFIELGLFAIAFSLVFLPGIFSSNDPQGNNYYLTKIQNVITERYSPLQLESPIESPSVVVPIAQSADQLHYPQISIAKTGKMDMIVHFLNNEFSSMAVLPVNFSFRTLSDQEKQPLWNFNSQPVWFSQYSAENLVMLILNFMIVLIGLGVAVKKYRLAGASAFLIQLGYHLGNAAAKTSGGRYLQPVNWVTLLYYSIGFVTLLMIGAGVLNHQFRAQEASEESTEAAKVEQAFPLNQKIYRPVFLAMGLFLICGLVVPFTNLLPSRLPEETGDSSLTAAEHRLVDGGYISQLQWENFLQDPNRVVIEGKAFDSIYYRSDFYAIGSPSFEVMALAKDHVFVSYLLNVEPGEPLTDGSDVILVGCKIGEDALWGANRIIVRSLGIIQTDSEGNIYVDAQSEWNCSQY
jgi:hypothetical protein